MWEYQSTDELYHFGIPGMRWGHHKAQVSGSSVKKKTFKQKVGNIKRKRTIAKKQKAAYEKRMKNKDFKNPYEKAEYKTKQIKKVGNTALGMKAAAWALKRATEVSYKNNLATGNFNTTKALALSAHALDKIGNLTMAGAAGAQVSNFTNYLTENGSYKKMKKADRDKKTKSGKKAWEK